MRIIGISAYYHDSAACLIINGDIVAAAQEERFTRIKHDSSFPAHALGYCLSEANVSPFEVDFIVFYDKPFLKFERILETYLAIAPRGFPSFVKSLPVWLKEKLFQKSTIINELNMLWGKGSWDKKLLFSEHHLSHACSAFFPSPFHDAAVLTMDGVGEWATTSLAVGTGNKLNIIKEIRFPHSLGLLYSAFTYYLGFKVNSGEYKVMGLAPYGKPLYKNLITQFLVDVKQDGSFYLDMSYFNYLSGLTMTSRKFHDLFGGPPRTPEGLITQREMDIASSIQAVCEEIVIKLAKGIKEITNQNNLCLAGGVALNCVANGKLLKEKIFNNIWIQPAAGDAGGAIGAALGVYYLMLNNPRIIVKSGDGMKGSYLGPSYDEGSIIKSLNECNAVYHIFPEERKIEKLIEALVSGKAAGWMSGRMEFGPRSLGSRSIIADPRSNEMMKTLNLKVKFRESFRPFAPCILREDLEDWFDLNVDSPYMLLVADVAQDKRKKIDSEVIKLTGFDKLSIERSVIPAVTHVDYSARVQTVHEQTNPEFYRLLKAFKEVTNCPVLVNTSFNVRGEPIVCTPEDAFRCFMSTNLDILVIENVVIYKEEQLAQNFIDYKSDYELD